jgi:pilus assembly protein Flp/PilA
MRERIHRQHHPAEKGQGLVEYALILVLVAVVVIVILSLLGPQIAGIFGRINCELQHRSSYSADNTWAYVYDQASYDDLLADTGFPSQPWDPSHNGCYGWRFDDGGNLEIDRP